MFVHFCRSEFLPHCNGRSPCFLPWTVQLLRVQLLMSSFCFRKPGIFEFSLWCFFRKRRRDLCKPDPASRCILQDSGLLARLSCEAFSGAKVLQSHLANHGLEKDALGQKYRQGGCCLPLDLTQKLIFFCHHSSKERAGRSQEARQVRAARAMDQADQNLGIQSSGP